jgi:hypothetical protein
MQCRVPLFVVMIYLLGSGCQVGHIEVGEREPSDLSSARDVDTPASTPDPADSVQLLVLRAWDEEGGVLTERIPNPSPPGPYLDNGMVYADAEALADVLAADYEITVRGGTLYMDQNRTPVPVRNHEGSHYVPVGDFASLYGAYTHVDRRMVVIYPLHLLCMMGRDARPGAPVFDGARAEGIFDRCPK